MISTHFFVSLAIVGHLLLLITGQEVASIGGSGSGSSDIREWYQDSNNQFPLSQAGGDLSSQRKLSPPTVTGYKPRISEETKPKNNPNLNLNPNPNLNLNPNPNYHQQFANNFKRLENSAIYAPQQQQQQQQPQQPQQPLYQARASGDQFRLITNRQPGTTTTTTTTGETNFNANNNNSNNNKLLQSPLVSQSGTATAAAAAGRSLRQRRSEDVCSDRLCYGLPSGCLDRAPVSQNDQSRVETNGLLCSVLVTSKHLIDPFKPVARDIHFELVALPAAERRSNYAAVGFSESGRMAGLVTECLQTRDSAAQLQVVKLAHSYNIPGAYTNVPVTILSGIKNLGVSFDNGYYQCRWIVESAVEFTYEDVNNGTLVQAREDLGYKNYHILLASGEYDERTHTKAIHSERVSSQAPISLAQTGNLKSLGTHLLIRIHGSLMIAIWLGLVTLSVIMARYYKNEWSSSKLNNLAIWFVVHRAFMLIAWFGTIIAIIFAYMYTETYHAGVHQISGTTCLVLASIQVLGGLLRPSAESHKRVYFNWAHFICGNLSYLFAMISIITAAYLAPAHLPPLYIWAVVAFVAVYALTHFTLTVHQYIVHKSSKISITPMSDLNDTNSSSATYSSCGGFVADSYPKENNSTFRQVMLGILVTMIIIFIVLLISLVNIR